MNAPSSEDTGYPARTRRQSMAADVLEDQPQWIAGRIAGAEEGILLRDESGTLPLVFDRDDADLSLPRPRQGEIVELYGSLGRDGRFHVASWTRLAPGRPVLPARSPNAHLFAAGAEPFVRRNRVKAAVRAFFEERGFLEVETPIVVPAAGQEPHIEPFRTRVEGRGRPREAFLITSPEYAHKRLLAAGMEKIFEMARAFRNGPEEGGGLHSREFTMLEWYRAYASCNEIMDDLEQLVSRLARDLDSALVDCLEIPFRRITVRRAFEEMAGVDLEPFLEGKDELFALEQATSGRYGLSLDDPAETRYFKILVAAVEPALRTCGPVFLVQFPASQAALSKVCMDDPLVCERFELYVNGVELANGFTELNDPGEQQRRFAEEARVKAAEGREPVPLDQAFLDALDHGIPPAGGVAVGLDRLMMLLYGETSLRPLLPFGTDQDEA